MPSPNAPQQRCTVASGVSLTNRHHFSLAPIRIVPFPCCRQDTLPASCRRTRDEGKSQLLWYGGYQPGAELRTSDDHRIKLGQSGQLNLRTSATACIIKTTNDPHSRNWIDIGHRQEYDMNTAGSIIAFTLVLEVFYAFRSGRWTQGLK